VRALQSPFAADEQEQPLVLFGYGKVLPFDVSSNEPRPATGMLQYAKFLCKNWEPAAGFHPNSYPQNGINSGIREYGRPT
jgi:hypothetical protein